MGSVHCSGVVGTQGCQMQDAGLSAGLEAHLLGPLALPMYASQAPPAARLQGLTHLVPATLTPDGDSTTSGAAPFSAGLHYCAGSAGHASLAPVWCWSSDSTFIQSACVSRVQQLSMSRCAACLCEQPLTALFDKPSRCAGRVRSLSCALSVSLHHGKDLP